MRQFISAKTVGRCMIKLMAGETIQPVGIGLHRGIEQFRRSAEIIGLIAALIWNRRIAAGFRRRGPNATHLQVTRTQIAADKLRAHGIVNRQQKGVVLQHVL